MKFKVHKRHRPSLSAKEWSKAAFSFVGLWFISRSPRLLLLGLPAMILFTAIPVMAISGRTATSRLDVRRTYETAAARAALAEDHDAAALWFRKLLTLNPNDQEVKFHLALAVDAQGDTARANALFDQLTPLDKAGYPAAHFYRAGQIVDQEEPPTPDDYRRAVWHLTQVLNQNPNDLQAKTLLANVQVMRGETAAAAEILEELVVAHPEVHLTVSGLYKKLGRDDTAEHHAHQARDRFRDLWDREPENVNHLLRLAEAHALSLQFREAETLLFEHLNKKLDVEATATALVKLAMLEVDLELEKDAPDWALVVSLLERSLASGYLHGYVFERIALVVGRHSGEKADQLREQLEAALADGRAPAVCHLLLGTLLGQNDQKADAIRHLEAARRVYPENPVVLNNLAYYLMESDPPQLEDALVHANLAAKLAPNTPEIQETRGQILTKLGRDAEALPDLEAALRMEEVPATLHKTLSQVYDRLGHDTMSERHRKRAAALEE